MHAFFCIAFTLKSALIILDTRGSGDPEKDPSKKKKKDGKEGEAAARRLLLLWVCFGSVDSETESPRFRFGSLLSPILPRGHIIIPLLC